MDWTEKTIGRAVSRQLFNNSAVVVVPNCGWTGHECDVLVVERNLRLIDIEVKISRADLKADAKKEKWWCRADSFMRYAGPPAPDLPRAWPPKVWKHYYAMPKAIWKPELLDCIPAASGVLLLSEPKDRSPTFGNLLIRVERMAKPCRDAEKLKPEAVLDVARLASLRMWEAYYQVEQHVERQRQAA